MNSLQAYIILCDLGDTFVGVDKISYAKNELGFLSILAYGLTNYLQFNPQKRIFQTLEKIGGTQQNVMHEQKHPLPKIYCDWLAGAYQDPLATRTWLLKEVDTLYGKGFFTSYIEYRIIYGALNAMFSPEKIIRHLYPIKKMIALLDRIDRSEHTIVAVTNWDQHSFPLFLESPVGKEITRSIKQDDMIVSGYIQCNKPHAPFYQHIFEKYGHHKENYLFIDNEIANIQAAQALGIPSIHFTGDVQAIERKLIAHGILLPVIA